MKILLPIIWQPLTYCIERAFQEAGHTTRVVNTRGTNTEALCIAEAKSFGPDLCFAQFQRPDAITKRFPDALREMGCFSVNWSGDVRHPLPSWYRDLARHFDVTSFTNIPDVQQIRAIGHRAEFLQIGYCEKTFNTEGAGERSGVVFLGNNYKGDKFAESEGRREVVMAMAEAFPDDFMVYGMEWQGICPDKNYGGYMPEPESPSILKSALVAIGWDHFHRPGFASDRILRATACGCAVVNQYYEGIEQEHPNVYAAHSIEDMIANVRYLLSDKQFARQMGERNAANTLSDHRWHNRVKVIESWMNR